MADIQHWDEVLSNEIADVHELMNKIPAITDRDTRVSAIAKVEMKLKGAYKVKKTLKMETRLLTEVDSRKAYEARLVRLGEDLSHLKADLSALKLDSQKEGLVKAAEHGTHRFSLTDEDGQKAGDDMLGEARGLQDKTQESLDYTKQMVAESKEVGISSLEELKRQRENLNCIDKEADRVDSGLDVAAKLVKSFGKRMASDRFIQCFAVLNVLLLVGVLLYSLLSGRSIGGINAGEGAPENPLATVPPARYLRSAFSIPEIQN